MRTTSRKERSHERSVMPEEQNQLRSLKAAVRCLLRVDGVKTRTGANPAEQRRRVGADNLMPSLSTIRFTSNDQEIQEKPTEINDETRDDSSKRAGDRRLCGQRRKGNRQRGWANRYDHRLLNEPHCHLERVVVDKYRLRREPYRGLLDHVWRPQHPQLRHQLRGARGHDRKQPATAHSV